MYRILLSTTSYQDTPGPHHALLERIGAEIVRVRGPLSEAQLLALEGGFDAFLCGDDIITKEVFAKFCPRLKLIAKYGIGVDKIDVAEATRLGIPVSFCPGVNHTTVAEHAFALILALMRHLVEEANFVRNGHWKRLTGHEVAGKTLAIIGLGRIGREMAIRGQAFGAKLVGFDTYWPEDFARQYAVERADTLIQALRTADIVSLHTNLTDQTREMINAERIALMKTGALVINCARGEIVNSADILAALKSGKIGGYGADVLEEEPPSKDHPLLTAPNCVLTPHIGSRTYESVERQAMMATENLVLMLSGKKPLAQVNDVPIPQPLGQRVS